MFFLNFFQFLYFIYTRDDYLPNKLRYANVFCTSRDRAENIEYFFNTIARIVSTFDRSTVVGKLREVGVPSGPVYLPEQVKDDPQVQARRTVKKYHHKIIGDFLGPKPLASMFGEAITLSDAPLQGEHSLEILSELGYPENIQRDLLKKSVIMKSET